MDAQVKSEKTEIPYQIRRGLGELWQLEMDIRELRKIQTALGYGQFGNEQGIKHLRYIASQLALECIERVCRETCDDVRERFTSPPSSEDTSF